MRMSRDASSEDKERSPGGGQGTKDMTATGRKRGRADDGTFRRSKGRFWDES
jgi:hypothetical protein